MDTKERLKYFYETVSASGTDGAYADYISPDCTLCIGEARIPIGVEGMAEHMTAVLQTYPDFHMRITRQLRDGDYIISEFIAEGTHRGEWLGMKPSGKKVTLTGVDIDKVVDGKIVEHGGAVNTFEGLWEAGLIVPAP